MKFRRVEDRSFLPSIHTQRTYTRVRECAAKCGDTIFSVSSSYAECIVFRSRARTQLFCLKLFVHFLSLARQTQGCCFKLGHNRIVLRFLYSVFAHYYVSHRARHCDSDVHFIKLCINEIINEQTNSLIF
jgi:hypothetical protein